MNSSELYDAFREDVRDTRTPYLWTDTEVFQYMNDAYLMFFRHIGGIGDATSRVTQIEAITDEMYATINENIIQVRSAYRVSDEREIRVMNYQDLSSMLEEDYGISRPARLTSDTGDLTGMIIGMEPNKVRWVSVPSVDDTVQLYVYRLPLDRITGPDQALTDLDERHHIHLLEGMKARAYAKKDAETLDQAKAEDNVKIFRDYCEQARLEWERYKHKPRSVGYGGI
jgi:hypothetical protein